MRASTRAIPAPKHRAGQLNSSSVLTLLKKGVAFHQIGKLQEAGQIYRDIITVNSAQPDALHLLLL